MSKRQNWLLAAGLVILVGMVIVESNSAIYINPKAYAPLLSTIAKGESGGNYNAYFGNAKNSKVRFTDMTVAEVLEWQSNHVAEGNVSNAVGKYQIIQPTLIGLIEKLKIEPSEKFDEELQDRLAITLLEQRGAVEYVNDKLSKEEFAANIAKEWAALPKATGKNPHDSYYAQDGINKSNVSVNEVFTALDELQKSAKNSDDR